MAHIQQNVGSTPNVHKFEGNISNTVVSTAERTVQIDKSLRELFRSNQVILDTLDRVRRHPDATDLNQSDLGKLATLNLVTDRGAAVEGPRYIVPPEVAGALDRHVRIFRARDGTIDICPNPSLYGSDKEVQPDAAAPKVLRRGEYLADHVEIKNNIKELLRYAHSTLSLLPILIQDPELTNYPQLKSTIGENSYFRQLARSGLIGERQLGEEGNLYFVPQEVKRVLADIKFGNDAKHGGIKLTFDERTLYEDQ